VTATAVTPLDETPAELAVRWGRSSVTPFHAGPDCQLVNLASGGFAGAYLHRGWAVVPTDPVTPHGDVDVAVADLLAALRARRLHLVMAASAEADSYRNRGLHVVPIAEDPILELADLTWCGSRRASIRHSIATARRMGLTVLPYQSDVEQAALDVSACWLATKRGGEMSFTLGGMELACRPQTDCRIAVDGDGRVVGVATWHHFDDGRARVLDVMRRLPDAPNPTMDLLVAASLEEFAAAGVVRVSLGSVPLSHGSIAEHLYPTVSLRRFKDKFAPRWEPRFLVAPSRRRLPAALLALGRAYCPDGPARAFRRNG
jgi:phosphatidylglycerol lysyltransferase